MIEDFSDSVVIWNVSFTTTTGPAGHNLIVADPGRVPLVFIYGEGVRIPVFILYTQT